MAAKTFEQNMERLDEIVRKLEDGGLPLDQGMKLFEEGAKLTIQLNKQLDAAEQKVRLMIEKTDGSSEEQPFEEEPV